MAPVTAINIRKQFGEVVAVDGISLTVRDAEFLVLLGPSGCGKTTLLRIIAGLEKSTSGEILIGGEVVNDVPPRGRGVAMVFQSYGLYPHLTVANNIAFPLRTQGTPKGEIQRKVAWAAGLLGIDRLPPPPTRAFRRRAPARGAGARVGPRADGFPARRAVVKSRRQTACERSQRTQAVPADRAHHHDLRDP